MNINGKKISKQECPNGPPCQWVTAWLAQVHLAALTAPLRQVATVLLACMPWASLNWEAAWVHASDHQGTAFGWKGCSFQQVEAIASLMSISSSLAAYSTSFLVSLGEGWIWVHCIKRWVKCSSHFCLILSSIR